MIEINDISFAYNRNSRNVLENISFDIQENRCIAILGNNGAGKSTLLKCIDRICPAQKGVVMIEKEDVFKMSSNVIAQNIAYVSQSNKAIGMTVYDMILLGRKPYIKWDATSEDRQIAFDIMHKMKTG